MILRLFACARVACTKNAHTVWISSATSSADRAQRCPIAGKTTFSESSDVRGDTAWRHCVKIGHGLLNHPLPTTPRTPCHPSSWYAPQDPKTLRHRTSSTGFAHMYTCVYIYVCIRRLYLSGTRRDWIKSTPSGVIWLKLWSRSFRREIICIVKTERNRILVKTARC